MGPAGLADIFDAQVGHRTHGSSLKPLLANTSSSIREWAIGGVWGNWIQITNKIDKDLEIKDNLFQPFVSSKADRMGLGLTLATILCQSINGILHYNTNTLKDEFSIMLCLP